ncbi:MAG: heme exporter protein CcmD [Verrucomicrobia bacterium]|nr:heme exporter protein CcmD [Verrucomicrobiota bacterium]
MKAVTNLPVPALAPASSLADANDIRDIKPPVDIPNPWVWMAWGLAVLALLALAAWVRRRRRQRRAQAATAPPIPPHVRAKQRLAAALSLIQDPKSFVIAVSDALRVYLEERFNYRAPERTTEEFLNELTTATSLYPDQKQSLAEFLSSCDLVKFARHEPTEDGLRGLHDAALRLVDETQFDTARDAVAVAGASL